MTQRWEAELFAAVQEGDEAAFKRIYELYHQRVRLVTWRIAHRADWVDDITNEAWCRAYTDRRHYDATRPFLVWMIGILRNVYREHCRKSPRHLPGSESSRAVTTPDESASPESLAEEAELLVGLKDCVSRLPADQAELVRLRFFEGKSVREMAEEIGVPESTLRDVRLPAVMKALRKCLMEKGIRFSELFAAHEGSPDQ